MQKVTIYIEDDEYNPFVNRNVAKPNSNLGTLIHLIKGSLATGILAMPLAFKLGGLAFGLAASIAVCLLYVYCVHLLVGTSQKACRQNRIPVLGFAETAEVVFANGPPSVRPYSKLAKNYINWMLLIHSLLTTCLFQIFVASSLRDVVNNQQQIEWGTLVYVALVTIPMVFITQIRHLRYLVPFSAVANVLMITAFGITLYFLLNGDGPVSFAGRNLGPDWTQLPLFFSTVLYAIQGIRYVLPIENDMRHPQNFLGFRGVVVQAIALLTVLYNVTGFFGYLRYGDDVKATVTLNLPTENGVAESTRLLAGLAVLFSMGLCFYVPMDIIWRWLENRIPPAKRNITQISMRFGILLVLTAITMGVPDLVPFVGFAGSFCSGNLVVLIPVVLDLVFRWPTQDFGRFRWILVTDCVLAVFGAFLLVTGTYASVRNIVAIYQ
ncbi:proton-coupled amino acid transporter-like protein pathetic isoform X2 [Culex quinquefasciatus]|uniref:proton-coupled amino acid transporter-like protein pathetic isoform X2 n=1 Tax=Culex quinquefasciatus TaxID=7176 RepID=UPI0018E3CA99|nr:proton-coupled amino acid transporter-like protein pathetic isoform X2 [Culex quinquefasciatus]